MFNRFNNMFTLTIKRASDYLQAVGGVPHPLDFKEYVQGPLTCKPFKDHIRKTLIARGMEEEVVDNALKDQVVGPAFLLNRWLTEKHSTLNEFLDSLSEYDYDHFARDIISRARNLNEGKPMDWRGTDRRSAWDMTQFIAHNSGYHSGAYNGHMLKDLKQEVIDDPTLLAVSIKFAGYGWPICLMSEKEQLKTSNVKMAMEHDTTDICYLHPSMLDNLEAMEYVARAPDNGANCIAYATHRVRNSKRIATIALYENVKSPASLSVFGDGIRDDDQMFLLAYIRDPNQFQYGSERLKKKYADLDTGKLFGSR